MARNILPSAIGSDDAAIGILDAAAGRLAPGGDIVLCETMVQEASRISEFIHMGPLQDMLLKAENEIYKSYRSKEELVGLLHSRFESVEIESYRFNESRAATPQDVSRWMKKSYEPALMKVVPDMTSSQLEKMERELVSSLCAAPLEWHTSCLIAKCSGTKETGVGPTH